jgi:predicted secreted protein
VSLTTAIATYFIIWWIVLFAVLPWGVRSQQEDGTVAPGTDPGAPMAPKLWLRLLWTTVAASAIFALCYLVYSYQLLSLEGFPTWSGPLR